jgi:hypothetical protein
MQNQKIQFKINATLIYFIFFTNATLTCSVLILQIFDEEGKKELKFVLMMSKLSKLPNKI